MIPNPAIYEQDEGQISSDLLPIERRKPKFLAWFLSILSPVQWQHDLIFSDYANGVNYSLWSGAASYLYGARVIYIDNAVYEMQNISGLTSTAPPNLDAVNWLKILDSFVGVRERSRYNSQKLLLEYALNRYFMVAPFSTVEWAPPAPPYSQIYISNTPSIGSNFWLSNGGAFALTSYMGHIAPFQKYFLGNTYPEYNPFSFTIFVPTAVYAAIQANQVVVGVTAEDVIRAFADRYVQAGKRYQVIQY